MSYTLYCYILLEKGKLAKLNIRPEQQLLDIRMAIYEEKEALFKYYNLLDDGDLQLYKPENLRRTRESDGHLLPQRARDSISTFSSLEVDESVDNISQIFGDELLNGNGDLIHLVVVPTRDSKQPRKDNRGDEVVSSLIEEYNSFFIKVTKWGSFEYDDLSLNNIREHPYSSPLPAFVMDFEKDLCSLVTLADEKVEEQVKCMMGSACHYFQLQENARGSEQCRTHLATKHEMVHAYMMADDIWDSRQFSMNEETASCLFYALLPTENIKPVEYLRSSQSWRFSLVNFCETSNAGKHRKYTPKNDYQLMKSGFPCYLVEVQSGDYESENDWPEDYVRMLLKGSFVVRFANSQFDAFKENKNFVLVCTYFWHNWNVSRYLLFQKQDNDKVYYKATRYELKKQADRLAHGREVYNLLQMLRRENNVIETEAIENFKTKVTLAGLKSFYSKSKGTKRRRDDGGGGADGTGAGEEGGGGRAGGSTHDFEEFRGHGYELRPEPEVIVDKRGCVWEPLFQLPKHIRVVHRLPGMGKELIAKKVRAGSDEVAILELLNNSRPKCENVISLLDSFRTRSGRWIILPKLETVRSYLAWGRGHIRGKTNYICWGLIKGLAHLHGLCIAHRDIKPDNLLLDANAGYCLKIIDFGFAMQVKDENEEVDDICGAETWMAPEVENETSGPYSPIKADRWACGRFILHILDKLQEEDSVLKAVGGMLKVDDPQQRPSLLEWRNWTTSLVTDNMLDDKAASHVSKKVIPQVRPRVVEYGKSDGVKRHRDSGVRVPVH